MLNRLKVKFVCIIMSIATILLIVILGLVVHFTNKNLEIQSIQMMQTIANKPFHPNRPNIPPTDVVFPYFLVQMNTNGDLIVTSNGHNDLSDEEVLQDIVNAALSSNQQVGVLEKYQLRFLKNPNPITHGFIFADISLEKSTMNQLIKTCVMIGILCFVVLLFLSFWLAHWAVKPMNAAWIQQKQFVADASHELKTPLTVILTNAELLQQASYTQAEQSQFTSSILTMSKQMRGLVENLLDLARVDNGIEKTSFTLTNFSQLVSDSVLPFEPLYYEKNLDLFCQVDEGLSINGSQSHLQQVLDILLDNAMKYSTPQTKVDLKLKRQGQSCLFSITNYGEHISSKDLKDIFKRFYRIDKARSMNHSYGLGLSIAEKIVHEHKGNIWAESNHGIITFYVQLPVQ